MQFNSNILNKYLKMFFKLFIQISTVNFLLFIFISYIEANQLDSNETDKAESIAEKLNVNEENVKNKEDITDEEDSEDNEDNEEILKMLEVIEQHTEIVTKTKLNVDYVPGMITVLYGDELEALGIQTMVEALSLVPGFEISMDQMGLDQIIVRKIGKTFSSGNVKFLLNSVSVNTIFNGFGESIHRIPISLIDRIEVIRGPGSAMHGEFAYVGVVNVMHS